MYTIKASVSGQEGGGGLKFTDEPTGNLDSKTGVEVISLMKFLSIKFHQTLMVVTHNDEIAQMSDQIIRLEDGKIC